MSKRLRTETRTSAYLVAGFVLTVGVAVWKPEAATAVAGAFAALCGALGWKSTKYIDGETKRPSLDELGARPAE